MRDFYLGVLAAGVPLSVALGLYEVKVRRLGDALRKNRSALTIALDSVVHLGAKIERERLDWNW